MTTIDQFIAQFAEAIEVEDLAKITPETCFRDLDEWGSLAYLSVIAFMDEEYDTQIEEADFKALETVEDLYKACVKD